MRKELEMVLEDGSKKLLPFEANGATAILYRMTFHEDLMVTMNGLSTANMGYLVHTKHTCRTILICSAVSICIEILQEVTGFGMFDWNDWIANSIGAVIGVVMVRMYRSSKAG